MIKISCAACTLCEVKDTATEDGSEARSFARRFRSGHAHTQRVRATEDHNVSYRTDPCRLVSVEKAAVVWRVSGRCWSGYVVDRCCADRMVAWTSGTFSVWRALPTSIRFAP
eukprot:scaffold29235_cov35-Tisochrysis_lutea.AAC.1